jgi:hypothetical protein
MDGRTSVHLHCINCIALLYCIALHCIALHCIALHCIALHCIVLHCIALHCIALHCITLTERNVNSTACFVLIVPSVTLAILLSSIVIFGLFCPSASCWPNPEAEASTWLVDEVGYYNVIWTCLLLIYQIIFYIDIEIAFKARAQQNINSLSQKSHFWLFNEKRLCTLVKF